MSSRIVSALAPKRSSAMSTLFQRIGTIPVRAAASGPSTGRIAREVDFASVDEVGAAVAAATAAFPAWRSTSLSKRTEILFRIRNLVETHRKEIAGHLTAEHGKVP